MGRPRKKQEAGEVHFQSLGVTVKIFFDPEKEHFFAEFAGCRFQNESLPAIKRALHDAKGKYNPVPWQPVIHIEAHVNKHPTEKYEDGVRCDSNNAHLSLDIERFWVAQQSKKQWAKACWYVEDGRSKNAVIWNEPSEEYKREAMRKAGGPKPDSDELRWARSTRYWNSGPGDFYIGKASGLREGPFRSDLPYLETWVPYTPELWAALNQLVLNIKDIQNKLSALLMTDEGRTKLMAGMNMLALPAAPAEVEREKRMTTRRLKAGVKPTPARKKKGTI